MKNMDSTDLLMLAASQADSGGKGKGKGRDPLSSGKGKGRQNVKRSWWSTNWHDDDWWHWPKKAKDNSTAEPGRVSSKPTEKKVG
ncbi:hypothetical protein Pmar_PMAR021802 [Perkinsus marinus ATCC 50983]|uniref:Uncharacterized protein n=1 Tax=Perkinsus marinus (strain ATCC 50983 / TXsc) TaxID=423536 RepID=C5LG42_PERM5|nr:hypothetical protein Pmar_PMAR021802 [Perkinsus marinus ATCC 50983]EER04297.1 hypothetical protein Pmar_PMAR021802 [Perkinsus marinus ATCC 50983]|eukprot:XP_002772481.1 hypothetical protein Pmar_PMAR021802 [Perkinsus marinus ATCC 50983]